MYEGVLVNKTNNERGIIRRGFIVLVEKLTGEQFITLNYSCHQSLSKTHIIDSASQLTNEKIYHMILVIIINVIGGTMLQRTLGSGWGFCCREY